MKKRLLIDDAIRRFSLMDRGGGHDPEGFSAFIILGIKNSFFPEYLMKEAIIAYECQNSGRSVN